MDFSKPVPAAEFLKTPEIIHDVAQNYVILQDSSINATFLKLIEAINLLDDLGWETVSITHDASSMSMMALVRRKGKAKVGG